MTEVRTYQAASMQEALELVRRELGAEAVILHTRQVSARNLLPWRKARQRVEITAGVGVKVRAQSTSKRPSPPKPAVARPATRPPESTPTSASIVTRPVSNEAYRSMPQLRDKAPLADSSTAGLTQQLNSMQKMLEKLAQSSQMRAAEEIPDELFHLYTELIDAEVEEELAREVIFRLKRTNALASLSDAQAARSMLTGLIASEFRCADSIVAAPGRRRVAALVGPTGVGKTTTIAKLAANFRLREGIRMGLVTVDTYRIAAVEQLRTYAEIIDLPMKVVTSPREMSRALDELTGLDLVLVDTAGRSPKDELKIQELKSLLAEAQVDDVFLVLSLGSSVRSLQATAEKFKAVNTTSMILTKLDEAAAMGTLLSVARKIPLPVSYLTTGQDVPDDIEVADADRMARLVLGQDQLFQ